MPKIRIAHQFEQNPPFWVTVDRPDLTAANGIEAWVRVHHPKHVILRVVDSADSVEPQSCATCPMWTESERTPNVGCCSLYDYKTLGHETPVDLCIVEFWQIANSSTPAKDLVLA